MHAHSTIRYEDLRAILLDYYGEHKPRSIRKRHTGETDSDGNKPTEEVFTGADKLDRFFKRMPITEIAAEPSVRWNVFMSVRPTNTPRLSSIQCNWLKGAL